MRWSQKFWLSACNTADVASPRPTTLLRLSIRLQSASLDENRDWACILRQGAISQCCAQHFHLTSCCTAICLVASYTLCVLTRLLCVVTWTLKNSPFHDILCFLVIIPTDLLMFCAVLSVSWPATADRSISGKTAV